MSVSFLVQEFDEMQHLLSKGIDKELIRHMKMDSIRFVIIPSQNRILIHDMARNNKLINPDVLGVIAKNCYHDLIDKYIVNKGNNDG